jgi:hypothetical protein
MAQDKTCQHWGLKPGTEACRLELSRQQLATEAAADRALADWQRSNAQIVAETAPLRKSQSRTYTSTTFGRNTSNC